MIAFFIATSTFIVISWIIFFYGAFTKKLKSTMYGFLSISYIAHALSCKIIGIPWIFYFIMSAIFFLLFSFNKKLENKKLEDDINKKEN